MLSIETLRRLAADQRIFFDRDSFLQRRDHYWDAPEIAQNAPQALRYAKALSYFLRTKSIPLREYAVFAGLLQTYDFTASMPVLYAPDFDPIKNPIARGKDISREMSAILSHTQDKHAAECLQTFSDCIHRGLFGHSPYGHVIPGFDFVVGCGFGEILARLDESLRLHPDRADYLCAMRTVVKGASRYFLRWAERAAEMAASLQGEHRENLLRIAASCRKMTLAAPETFFDALQMVLLLQEIITTETPSGSISFGRLDQLLYPFYQRDLQTGRITPEIAQRLVDAFRIQVASLVHAFQNITLCGCSSDGRFAGNEVSLMFLRSAQAYRFDQPLLSMRITEDTPDDYWDEAINLLALGDGFPALHNDAVVIPTRIASGVDVQDAWNYGIVGCVEPSIGGNEFSNTEQLRINWAKVLEMMLLQPEGRFPAQRRALDSISCFEDLCGWFRDELNHAIHFAADTCNLIDSAFFKEYPIPLLSSTMPSCIKNGMDAADRGPKYCFSTINNCGMANAVDSLLAIKKAVFEEKIVTLDEMKRAIESNFADYKQLRQYVQTRCEKFGNDTPQATALMRDLTSFAADEINACPNCRGAHFMAGMYSVEWHAALGALTGATPDGRLAGVSLANAICPMQGMDTAGPTAVINAATALDHTKFENGMVLDLKFSPHLFADETHRKAIRALLHVYFLKGGMEMQLNVVNHQDLLDAQKHPEKHQNLIVRVSGFSAYFTNLGKLTQDEIIARTLYANAG